MKNFLHVNYLFLIISGLCLGACGTSRSIDGYNDVGASDQTSTTNLAHCTPISGSLSGRAETYINSQGALHSDSVRIRIDQAPSTLDSTDAKIAFFRWQAQENGTYLEKTPVSFYLEDRDSLTVISGTLDSLLPDDIATISEQVYSQAMKAQEFLTKVNIVLTDVGLDFDALKIGFYNGETASAEIDFLIPGFEADPTLYAETHNQVLASLHPNYTQRESGLDSTGFLSLLQRYCF